MKRPLLTLILITLAACPAHVRPRPNDEVPAKMTPADVDAENARAAGQAPPLPGSQPPLSTDPK